MLFAEAVQERSSSEESSLYQSQHETSAVELPEQISEDLCDRDKDSQTSTIESGYESQSKETQLPTPQPLPRTTSTTVKLTQAAGEAVIEPGLVMTHSSDVSVLFCCCLLF